MLDRKYFQATLIFVFLLSPISHAMSNEIITPLLRFRSLNAKSFSDLSRLQKLESESKGALLSYIKLQIAQFYLSNKHIDTGIKKLEEIINTQAAHRITLEALEQLVQISRRRNNQKMLDKYSSLIKEIKQHENV